MELTVLERIVLLSALPNEGNFTTLKIVRNLREDLSFTEEEHKVLDFKQTGDNISWNPEVNVVKDFSIGEKATEIIVNSIKKLNDSNKLTEQHYSLYEKFVGE